MPIEVLVADQQLTCQQVLAAEGSVEAATELGVQVVLGAGGGPPPPPAYGYVNAVEFDGPASDGANQRMDTGKSEPGGLSAFTMMMVFELDVWHGSILATQWTDNPAFNSWIIAPSSDGDYGPGSNGLRLWIQNGGGIIACQALIDPPPAAGTRVQVVVRYDGSGVGNAARARIWVAIGAEATLTEYVLTFLEPFGPSSVPAALNTSTSNFYVGGGTYSTARAVTGVILDAAYWASALDPTDIAALRAAGAPVDPETVIPCDSHWWMGNGDNDVGTFIEDIGADGFDGTLETGGNPATAPVIVAL
jgi:hypothetical protein